MGCSDSWPNTPNTRPTRPDRARVLREVGVDTGDPPIGSGGLRRHTCGMDSVLTKITDLGLLSMLSLPMIVASLLLAAAAWTGLAGRMARLLEDLRVLERMRF